MNIDIVAGRLVNLASHTLLYGLIRTVTPARHSLAYPGSSLRETMQGRLRVTENVRWRGLLQVSAWHDRSYIAGILC